MKRELFQNTNIVEEPVLTPEKRLEELRSIAKQWQKVEYMPPGEKESISIDRDEDDEVLLSKIVVSNVLDPLQVELERHNISNVKKLMQHTGEEPESAPRSLAVRIAEFLPDFETA